ncbi:arginase family protein [Labrenzia sp. R4_2]|uniref:arginase family protein n=1 Tax=Labrenzia sp. R4_2 TaxID=2821107 RepID=UPI001ADB711E|nr:arginase family protein [Labrenzia sp. R4_2]MBO9422519.1 arginase family protein [Labrenzia sp. R4_2]
MQFKKLGLPVVALGLIASMVSPSHAQMLKDIAEAAPNENIGPMPHEVPGDPTKMNIKQDKSTNIWRELREGTGGKEPGPIDIQRYNLQMEPVGIQTFFKLPVAITPEDLKAGEIDIAIFGAPTGALPHSAGNMWAPAEVRTTRDYGGYGDPQFPLSWIEYETLIAPFTILNAVDYGDVGLNPYNQSHTMEEIRRVTREVASVGAIPFIVGGDHSVPNGTYRGIVDVYGKNNVAILHFDVHLDRDMGLGKFGAYYHSGVFMNRAVEEGMVEGRHIIQYGMSTPVFGAEEYDKAAADGAKVYHIHEIRRDGVRETFDKIYEDLKDIDLVYVSFDIDTFDMAYAPGTGSSSPIGSKPEDLFPLLREFAATKTIVGADFVEFNPFYDNKGQQTARLVRRTMFQFLTGIAMKKEGMDPKYIHPRVSGEP